MSSLWWKRNLICAMICALVSTYSYAQPSRQVAITIDDGPASVGRNNLDDYLRVANQLREAFLEEQVPVTLFVNERQLNIDGQRDARVAVLDAWLTAGLDVGNHTYAHTRPRAGQLHKYYDDIVLGEYVTRRLMRTHGQQLKWYRYPYLATKPDGDNPEVGAAAIEEFLQQRGYQIAPVTVDYKDYSFSSNYMRYVNAGQLAEAEEFFSGVMRALDAAFESSERQSMQAIGREIPQVLLIHCNEMNSLKLKESLERMRARGYSFVSLDEAMSDPVWRSSTFPPGVLGAGSECFRYFSVGR